MVQKRSFELVGFTGWRKFVKLKINHQVCVISLIAVYFHLEEVNDYML